MSDELFRQAPKAVRDYFERRPNVPTFSWKDFAPHEHALGFTVAKTAVIDVIDDLRKAVKAAVVDRVPFAEFQKQLEPILRQKGWWGRQVATDPVTKRDQMVQLGSTRRLQVIYWGNVASAEAAGEWQRTQETKAFLPYLTYKLSVSERKRPEHRGWVGITLPVDDAWWRTHYPPNGWFCKCRVEQISGPQADRIDKGKRVAPKVAFENYTNKRTGLTERVPTGIDPGWQTNPGLTRERTLALALANRIDPFPDMVRQTVMADMRGEAVFRHIGGNAGDYPYPQPRHPADLVKRGSLMTPAISLPRALQRAIGSPTPIAMLTVADGAKMVVKHKVGVETYALAQQIASDPDDVAPTGKKWRAIKLIDGEPWLIILKITNKSELILNSFHRIGREKYQQIMDEDDR